MRARFAAVVAALGIYVALAVSALSPASGVADFGDVAPGRFYTEAIQWMVDHDITNGTSAACFSPDDAVTRGQASALIWRMQGRPAAASHPYVDVVADYQHGPVAWMHETGVTTGTSASTFTPDRPLARGEVAAFLWRLAGQPQGSPPHAFADITEQWQHDAVSWLVDAGITTGTSPTTFSPADATTRAELATFLYRYAGEPPVGVDPSTPYCAPPTTTTIAPPPPPPAPPPPPSCDPNYSGACVPIASDVDCAGGSGNGPAYVRGPVYVVGRDIYDLDRDNDGVGCE